MKTFICIAICIGSLHTMICQNQSFTYEQVMNPRYGINFYDALNFRIGGDSVRKCNGYACRGWIKDYYDSGQLLHLGYYMEGQLRNYKNFYPSGSLEREFKILDDFRSLLTVYYADGKVKSYVKYMKSSPVLWQDYYANGNLEYYEEYDKKVEYYVAQKFYYENGNPKSILELTDKKKLYYTKKEYYENGQLKEYGSVFYNTSMLDYEKKGVWIRLDESGNEIEKKEY